MDKVATEYTSTCTLCTLCVHYTFVEVQTKHIIHLLDICSAKLETLCILTLILTGVFGGALVVEVRGDDLLLRGGARAVGRGDGGGARLGVPLSSIDVVDIVDITHRYVDMIHTRGCCRSRWCWTR